jgi:hypothetical protein
MKFFRRFFSRPCSHPRFSWPRVGVHGQHYQVCLQCGKAFAYDWELMRRTGPLTVQDDHLKEQTDNTVAWVESGAGEF